MWHQGQQGLPSPWILVPASLGLCILTCAMGGCMKIREASLGLREEKLVSVSFVGGSDVLLTRLRDFTAPCSQQEFW